MDPTRWWIARSNGVSIGGVQRVSFAKRLGTLNSGHGVQQKDGLARTYTESISRQSMMIMTFTQTFIPSSCLSMLTKRLAQSHACLKQKNTVPNLYSIATPTVKSSTPKVHVEKVPS